MPLSVADAARLNNAVTAQLRAVGQAMRPQSTVNTDSAAYDLFIAQRIRAFGEAAIKEATKQAVAVGVLFDHKIEPKTAGTDEDVYSGDTVRINVKVKNGSKSPDLVAIGHELVSDGVLSATAWTALLDKHTRTNAAPHTFTASLKT